MKKLIECSIYEYNWLSSPWVCCYQILFNGDCVAKGTKEYTQNRSAVRGIKRIAKNLGLPVVIYYELDG